MLSIRGANRPNKKFDNKNNSTATQIDGDTTSEWDLCDIGWSIRAARVFGMCWFNWCCGGYEPSRVRRGDPRLSRGRYICYLVLRRRRMRITCRWPNQQTINDLEIRRGLVPPFSGCRPRAVSIEVLDPRFFENEVKRTGMRETGGQGA